MKWSTAAKARVPSKGEELIDGCGQEWLTAMDALSNMHHGTWPEADRVSCQEEIGNFVHSTVGECQVCGWPQPPLDVHHIIGGTKGRSDERTNLIVLCRWCHEDVNSERLPMGAILWYKWLSDREHTDWTRLAVLRGMRLPEPIMFFPPPHHPDQENWK